MCVSSQILRHNYLPHCDLAQTLSASTVTPGNSAPDPTGPGEPFRVSASPRLLCVAPMMAWTDRHCRYLLRLASPNALLFTEMITAAAVLHGDHRKLLAFHPAEHPVALQLGGSDPRMLAEAAQLATQAGFDEINLNVGCPSPRVKRGRFGACLMLEPDLVAECVRAMRHATSLPVTVKCRLGVDHADSDPLLHSFVAGVVEAGCDALYLHARKAWLSGLTPAQNRDVPPLQPQRAYGLKQAFPELPVVFNGGVTDIEGAKAHLQHVDGVMVGRAAYHSPQFLAQLDEALTRVPHRPPSDDALVAAYLDYVATELNRGTRLHDMTRHMLGMFKGRPGARAYRRLLSDAKRIGRGDIGIVHEALAALRPRAAA